MTEKTFKKMAGEKRFKLMAEMIAQMRETFDAGYYAAMADMQVMNSNEQIAEACEAAFIRWNLGADDD